MFGLFANYTRLQHITHGTVAFLSEQTIVKSQSARSLRQRGEARGFLQRARQAVSEREA